MCRAPLEPVAVRTRLGVVQQCAGVDPPRSGPQGLRVEQAEPWAVRALWPFVILLWGPARALFRRKQAQRCAATSSRSQGCEVKEVGSQSRLLGSGDFGTEIQSPLHLGAQGRGRVVAPVREGIGIASPQPLQSSPAAPSPPSRLSRWGPTQAPLYCLSYRKTMPMVLWP